MAVTTADIYAKGKSNRFVGICTRRGGYGLGATFILRNVINDLGKFMFGTWFSSSRAWILACQRVALK